MIKKPANLLSSWWLFVLLVLMICSAYLYFSFGEKPFERWTYFLFKSAAGRILYITLILNLLAISVSGILKKLRDSEITRDAIMQMDAYVEISLSGVKPRDEISDLIRKSGFDADISRNTLTTQKGRFSSLPGTVMRAGLVMLMTALLFSSHMRRTDERIFHGGDESEILGRKIRISDIRPGIPEEFIEIGEKSIFTLDSVSAVLTSESKAHAVSSKMPSKIDGVYFRITDTGYSQPVSLGALKSGTARDADIDLLPPGKTDDVSIADDLFLAFTLKPERFIEKGVTTGKVFNLKNPVYGISLLKGKTKEKTGDITLKPSASGIAGNYKISLGNNSFFIKVQSVYDPALSWIYLGIIVTLAGIALMFSRFFWYEKRMSALFTDDKVLIGYTEEFYKKWGIMKFYSWFEETKPD